MTDAEFEAQKERLRALQERWHGPLGLKWWRIEHVYERDSAVFQEVTNASSASNTLATCKADWRYLLATITWNIRGLLDRSDEDLERDFVHELMHVFLEEISVEDDNHRASEERVASTLANAFIWVRDFTQEGKSPAIAKAADA